MTGNVQQNSLKIQHATFRINYSAFCCTGCCCKQYRAETHLQKLGYSGVQPSTFRRESLLFNEMWMHRKNVMWWTHLDSPHASGSQKTHQYWFFQLLDDTINTIKHPITLLHFVLFLLLRLPSFGPTCRHLPFQPMKWLNMWMATTLRPETENGLDFHQAVMRTLGTCQEQFHSTMYQLCHYDHLGRTR